MDVVEAAATEVGMEEVETVCDVVLDERRYAPQVVEREVFAEADAVVRRRYSAAPRDKTDETMIEGPRRGYSFRTYMLDLSRPIYALFWWSMAPRAHFATMSWTLRRQSATNQFL